MSSGWGKGQWGGSPWGSGSGIIVPPVSGMPTSDEFDCMDIQLVDMASVLTFTEVSASRGTPWVFIESGTNDLVIYSDDNQLSRLEISLPVTNKFTYETTFKPSALPIDLSNLSQFRFFIGAFDQTDNGGGILLSRSGLAVVGGFGSSAIVIPGSLGLLPESNTYYTLAVTVDGDANEMNIYITKTSDVYLYGHQLRYTTAAPVTPSGTLDSLVIEILGQSTRTIRGHFDTLRLNCTRVLVPNKRPVADPGADQASTVGSPVTHDGTNSYDPEGYPLTYAWFLEDAPTGSRYKIAGVGGTTIDDGDSDGVTTIFIVPSSTAFSVLDAPTLQPGDTLVVAGILYTVSLIGWVYDGVTTFKYIRDSSWSDDRIYVTEDLIPDNLTGVAWYITHTSTYFSNPVGDKPFAIPDIQGLYTIRLVVNDGSLDSLPAQALLNVASTFVSLGCIPDVSFIWDNLSDFWNLVDDKEKAETVWTGFAQAAAASLLTAWQVDYNKSLIDIQKVFQRRWLSYSTLLEDDPETAVIKIIRGPIFSVDLAAGANVTGLKLEAVLDGGAVETVTFTGSNPISVDNLVTQINTQLGFTTSSVRLARKVIVGPAVYLVLEYSLLLQLRPNGNANTVLGYSATAYTQNDLQGTAGLATGASLYAFAATNPPVVDFAAQGIGSTEVLIKAGSTYRTQKAAVNGLTLLDPLPDTVTSSWLVPSTVVSKINDFSKQIVVAGDLVRFEVRDIATDTPVVVLCSVVGAVKDRVGFDPRPLLAVYAGNPDLYSTTFLGIKHTQHIPVDSLIVEIPRLQYALKCGPEVLQENADYILGDFNGYNSINFRTGTFSITDPPADTYWAELTYLDNRPTIESNFGSLVSFTVEDMEARSDNLDYLSAVRGLWWAYFGGPAIERVRVGTQILLGLPFSEEKGTIEQLDPFFTAVEGRILIRDAKNASILRSYYYPRAAGLALSTVTGEFLKIGDVVGQFDPLSGGIEVLDYVSSPNWANAYIGQGFFTEVEKYFRFLIRGDVDTFDVANMVFAIDFVKKIKPHYTFPLFVFKKNIPTSEVNVSDDISMNVVKRIYQSTCPHEPGSYRWDDTDGGGLSNYAYDEAPPPFLFDTSRLCPDISVYVLIQSTLAAGLWDFDSLWAFDDGDTDGDSISDDIIPLSGPDSSAPLPYGPLVGVVAFDVGHVSGTFTRSFYL